MTFQGGFRRFVPTTPAAMSPYPLHKCMDTSLTLSWKNGKWHFSLRPKGPLLTQFLLICYVGKDEVENGANILRD